MEKFPREIDAHVGVPSRALSRVHRLRNTLRLNLLDLNQDAVSCAKSHYNLGDAKEERLDPELHELAVEIVEIAGGADLHGGFELDPVDGLTGGWFRVPYFGCGRRWISMTGVNFFIGKEQETGHGRKGAGINVLASTSPPRQRTVLPMPVRTTEQYCSLLLTTWFSRSSMYSLDVSCHVLGRVERVSNL